MKNHNIQVKTRLSHFFTSTKLALSLHEVSRIIGANSYRVRPLLTWLVKSHALEVDRSNSPFLYKRNLQWGYDRMIKCLMS